MAATSNVQPTSDSAPAGGDTNLFASIKEVLCASVGGPWYEKALYYILVLGSFCIFGFSSCGIFIKFANEKITTVEMTYPDNLQLPGVWTAIPISISGSTLPEVVKFPDPAFNCSKEQWGNCHERVFSYVADSLGNPLSCTMCWYGSSLDSGNLTLGGIQLTSDPQYSQDGAPRGTCYCSPHCDCSALPDNDYADHGSNGSYPQRSNSSGSVSEDSDPGLPCHCYPHCDCSALPNNDYADHGSNGSYPQRSNSSGSVSEGVDPQGSFDYDGGANFTVGPQYSAGKDGQIQQIIARDILKAENDLNKLYVIYVLNSDGKFVSKRSSPTTITQEFAFRLDPTAEHSFSQLLKIGLFDPTLEKFTPDDFRQMWAAGVINKHTQMKISIDKFNDLTKGENRSLYQASVSSVDQVISFGPNQDSPGIDTRIRQLPGSPTTRISFEIGNWFLREATTRRMYLSELLAELGGCWTSSLFIIAFFFYQKVGGSQGKIQIFRFKGQNGRKKLLRHAGEELAVFLAGKAVDEMEAQTRQALDGQEFFGTQASDIRNLLAEQDELFVAIAREGGAEAKNFAIKRLRPKLEPKVKEHNLVWEDVLPVLDLITVDILLDAFEDPDKVLRMFLEECGEVARKFMIAKIRKTIEASQSDLTWKEMEGSLENCTEEELRAMQGQTPEEIASRSAKQSILPGQPDSTAF